MASPFSSIVTTLVLSLVQITDLFVALAGSTMAVNCTVWPVASPFPSLHPTIRMLVTGTLVTVMVHVAVNVLSATDLAVMVQLPAALAVTNPLCDTVATLVLLLDHVTVLLMAPVGVTIVVSCAVEPVFMFKMFWLMVRSVISVFFLTARTQQPKYRSVPDVSYVPR